MNCSATRQRIKVWLTSGLGLATMFHSPTASTIATRRAKRERNGKIDKLSEVDSAG